MVRRILLTGGTGFLGGYLALELLAQPDAELYCLVRASDASTARRRLLDRLEPLVARYGWPGGSAPTSAWERVHAIAGALGDLGGAAASHLPPTLDELWHSAASLSFDERSRPAVMAANVEGTRAVLGCALARGARVVNHVSTAYVAGARGGTIPEGPFDSRFPAFNPYEESKRVAEELVVEGCGRHGARFRIFRPSIVMGDSRDHGADSESSAYGFASAVATLKGEIAARIPDYFEAHPLRVLSVPRHVLSFVACDRAAATMVRAAARVGDADRWVHVVSPDDTSLVDVLRAIGEAAGVGIDVVHSEHDLNPMDMLLRTRTSVYQCYLSATKRFESSLTALSGDDPRTVAVSLDDHRRWFEAHRAGRAAGVIERRNRMRRALTLLDRREVDRPDGRRLVYYAGGSGTRTLVIVNAFGQSLYFWNWFVLASIARCRVVLWQARGTADDHDTTRPFVLADHVDDLLAVLDRERVDVADVLGWCTGPKVALELVSRAPSRVRSLVLVTGAFKPMAGHEDLHTAYEESMEPLCRAIDEAPEAAATVMEALKAIVGGGAASRDALDVQIADVLRLVPEELRGLVIRPFLDTESIVRYARQLLDFWSFDVSAALRRIPVPTLFVGAEYDAIASPAITRAAAAACPGARHAEIAGGTHFVMFENHELFTALVHAFVDDPTGFRFVDPEVRISEPSPSPSDHRAVAAPRQGG